MKTEFTFNWGKWMPYILPVRNKSKYTLFSLYWTTDVKVLSSKTFILKTKELSRTAYQFSIQQETKKSDNGNPSLIVAAFASPAWKRLSNPAILLHKSDCTKTLQLSRIIDNRCLAWVFENQEETSEADWNIICRHVVSSWRDSRAKTQTVMLSFHL